MTSPNPLVATAAEGPVDPWAGVWIAEDIETLCRGVKDGSDPGQIAAHAQTWRNVAGALHGRAAELEQAVRWDVSE